MSSDDPDEAGGFARLVAFPGAVEGRRNPMPERLRICYLLSHFYPRESGAERQAMAQGIELARRGHSVRVVTRSIEGQPREETVDGRRGTAAWTP